MDHPAALSSDLIGRESEVALFEVERGAIRKFADAVQDQTPACVRGDIAPPTFPTTFRMTIPGVTVGLDGVIGPGMLSRACVGEYLCWLAGPESVRRLSVRFVEMVRPADTLTCRGRVKERTSVNTGRRLQLEVWAENQRAVRVTVGEAEVEIA